MFLAQHSFRPWIVRHSFMLVNVLSLSVLPFSVNAEHVLALRLAPTPFSPSMCKISKEDWSIQILVAKHRDLFLKKVPGQHQPMNLDEARKKDYVHFVTLADLTDNHIQVGAIAFDNRHAVIFDNTHDKGISRPKFLAHLPKHQRLLGEKALNTFLRLHAIFNAAVDTCRPRPAFPDYENDDHLLRIEEGKLTFKNLVQQYNKLPSSPKDLYPYEPGKIEGFVDPEAGKDSNISYQAMNPLNFYIPTSHP